ncbi:MAG TPA: LUD domain-containing protein [Anaerolineales bacterium]|nr:LUD domain-containing protein [Anaerolineales bacterium]
MSTSEFRAHIRASLANEALQSALDTNNERRVHGRALAFESIPDWRERRKRAHAIRTEVIEHLDEYLWQFIAQNERNGVIVHCAKDAQEANQIVLDVARQTSARLIAKSKSMVSEEINLNHALEAQGIRVVETDLGEYIVQLRNEKPSHIITPAVHLRRNDVGQLFHERLGIPYTEDIPTLTNTARKILRDVFLTADIGMSGVNFGIAETGAICLVTNEGNGRMVTTLPKTHIALMGMERILPDLDDLALMLSLLARSATTQKLSVYTQLLRKPLPNQTRHILLLDNGRTRLRNSPLKESLYCIRCGACLNACPVFREIGGHAYIGRDRSIAPYPGPIGSIVSPGLLGENFVHLAQASSLCGACKEACPVDIDLPKMLTRVRAGQTQSRERKLKEGGGLSSLAKFSLWIYSRITRSPRLFTVSQKFAALGSRLFAPFSDWIHLPVWTGWGYSKDFPRFAGKTFRQRFAGKKGDLPAERQIKTGTVGQVDAPASKKINNLPAQFTYELTTLGGQVRRVENVTEEIIQYLKTMDIDRLILEPDVLDESLLDQAGIIFTHEPDPSMPVGVTKALCGLADTGSILEADGLGNPLHASLLPETHIAILHESDILPSLPNAMQLIREKSAAVFITGPSRTSDIEMSLTIGVHGPGQIIVFLVR